MNHSMTFRQYRRMDLVMFGAMLAAAEAVIVMAATRWFPAEPYTVSAVAAVTAIVLMRWGPWAAIHAVLGALVFCRVSGGTPQQYLIYIIGNLFSMAALLMFRMKSGKERIREDSFLTVTFAILVQLLMQLGRAVTAAVLLTAGGEASMAATSCLGFFTTDALSVLFTALILWIARRQDGIFEDQKHYLLRIQQAEKEERGDI